MDEVADAVLIAMVDMAAGGEDPSAVLAAIGDAETGGDDTGEDGEEDDLSAESFSASSSVLLFESGFTGTVFGADGRTYHYVNGIRVKGPRVTRDRKTGPSPVRQRELQATVVSPVPYPKSRMPVAVPPELLDESDRQLKVVFGRQPRGENAAELTAVLGMPDDALGQVVSAGGFKRLFTDDARKPGASGVRVRVTHPGLGRVSRFVGVDGDGNRFIRNEILEVKDRGSGLGVEIFTKQVESASAAGIDYIETHAIGSWGTSFNGYYTWAAFGYDAPLDKTTSGWQAKAAFPGAKTVQDVMDSPAAAIPPAEVKRISDELNKFDAQQAAKRGRPIPPPKERTSITGAEWWKVNGSEMKSAKFDLDPNRRSMRRLRRYVSFKQAGA